MQKRYPKIIELCDKWGHKIKALNRRKKEILTIAITGFGRRRICTYAGKKQNKVNSKNTSSEAKNGIHQKLNISILLFVYSPKTNYLS